MLNLIPSPKSIEYGKGYLSTNAILPFNGFADERILVQINKLPTAPNGSKLTLTIGEQDNENYSIQISETGIEIIAEGVRGGFY